MTPQQLEELLASIAFQNVKPERLKEIKEKILKRLEEEKRKLERRRGHDH